MQNNDLRFKIWFFHLMTTAILIASVVTAWRYTQEPTILSAISTLIATLYIPIHLYGSGQEKRLVDRLVDAVIERTEERFDYWAEERLKWLDELAKPAAPAHDEYEDETADLPMDWAKNGAVIDDCVTRTPEQLEAMARNVFVLMENGYQAVNVNITSGKLGKWKVLPDRTKMVDLRGQSLTKYAAFVSEWKRAGRLDEDGTLTADGLEFLSEYLPYSEPTPENTPLRPDDDRSKLVRRLINDPSTALVGEVA